MIDLKSREKKFVALCAAVVLAAVINFFLVAPSVGKRDDLRQSIRNSRVQLEDLRKLAHEYDQILKETQAIRKTMGGRGQSFELLPFLSQTANRLNLKNNLTSMRPSRRTLGGNLSEDLVELELRGVSLENLVDYLPAGETAGAAGAVASIRVSPESRLGGGLNVSMLVTSINAG